jgi:palmitoyltransferase ZDHHC5/8
MENQNDTDIELEIKNDSNEEQQQQQQKGEQPKKPSNCCGGRKKQQKNEEINLNAINKNGISRESLRRSNTIEKSISFNLKQVKRALPCLFAWSLLLTSTGVYFTLVLPEIFDILNENFIYWSCVLAIQFLIFIHTLMNFALATFKDPGRYAKQDEDLNDDSFKSPLYKNILIKNNLVKTKWCSSCNFYRPLRCSHCSICDACIDQFDHHCPWLSNCVGKRNYRFFIQFLFFIILHMISIFTCCLIVVLKTSLSKQSSIAAFVLIGIISLLIIPIGGLFIFHLMLISKARTTNEQVTAKYKGLNLFQQGFCKNFATVICASIPPKFENYSNLIHQVTLDEDEQPLNKAKYAKTTLDSINIA